MIDSDTVMDSVDRIMSCPLEWGISDCCTSACDVFQDLHGIDPMRHVRGSYSTPGGAARLFIAWGGFMALVQAMARQTGLIIGHGEPGEIGLSSTGNSGTPDGRTLLICIEPGAWAGKTENGYAILSNAEICWRP